MNTDFLRLCWCSKNLSHLGRQCIDLKWTKANKRRLEGPTWFNYSYIGMSPKLGCQSKVKLIKSNLKHSLDGRSNPTNLRQQLKCQWHRWGSRVRAAVKVPESRSTRRHPWLKGKRRVTNNQAGACIGANPGFKSKNPSLHSHFRSANMKPSS